MPLLKPPRGTQLNKAHPLARGLVGCWVMNEGTGSKVFDLSGNRNTGTIYNALWQPGKFGSALYFDGSGDYVNCGTNASLLPDIFTVTAWIKTTKTTDNGLVRWANYRPTIFIYNSKMRIDLGATNYRLFNNNPVNILDNNWHHVALIVTGNGQNDITNSKMYADGQAQDIYYTESATSPATKTLFEIGMRSQWNEGPFDGLIDGIHIWNRALSAAEIAHLYREPFCMFDLPIESGLLYPAGQIVWLTAASTATSSVYGTLTKQSKLAGIIDAAAALSAILTWCYRGQVERQWLIEALFNGMTANAFKLGTALCGGWFWMRRFGCCALYRGPSMEQIDFANILTVAEQDAGSISPPDYLPHHSNSTYFYVVRRFNICGYQERTLAAAVKVAIDADGNLIEPKPNNIFVWRLDQVYGNKIQLIWFYCPLEQESKPESFRIYYDGGTGLVDYENPIATINYQGRKFYTYQSDALAAGRYLFAVRAEDAAGIENNSLAQLAVQLNITNPDAIDILSVENI